MKLFLLLTLAVGTLSQLLEYDLEQWQQFKITHKRQYASREEESKRKEIFLENLDFVRHHNQKYERGEESYSVEINQFADMTDEEFQNSMTGYRYREGEGKADQSPQRATAEPLPASVDWRTQGAVTDVKDQGGCASSYSFSATGALEGAHFLKTGNLVSLSEQNLIDCSRDQGNSGCGDGNMENSFAYVIMNHGIDTEESYYYQGFSGFCRYKNTTKGATALGYVALKKEDEDVLQASVATVGPVSAAIYAGQKGFKLYKSGIYKSLTCWGWTWHLNHAVLVIGYGTETSGKKSQDYWLVKNSWGVSWGESGYIRMARNHFNMCGIATAASYPTV